MEIQQASDITYRLYDYDRKDADGNLRDLHLEKSKEAIKIYKDEDQIKSLKKEGYDLKILTENEFFEVREIKIKDEAKFERTKDYLLEAVVDGRGQIEIGLKTYPLKKGDFFIITNKAKNYIIKGDLTMVESNPV